VWYFLFLRSGAATVIPSIAVPLSSDWHVRGDVSSGQQLNNPLVMALTILTASS